MWESMKRDGVQEAEGDRPPQGSVEKGKELGLHQSPEEAQECGDQIDYILKTSIRLLVKNSMEGLK